MLYLPFPFLLVNFPHELFTTPGTSQTRTAAQDRARDAKRFAAGETDGVGTAACVELFAWAERAISEDSGPYFEGAATAGG